MYKSHLIVKNCKTKNLSYYYIKSYLCTKIKQIKINENYRTIR